MSDYLEDLLPPESAATSPVLVAFVRGLLGSLAAAVIPAVGLYLSNVDAGAVIAKAWWFPVVFAGWRTVEGIYDRKVRQQAPQDGIVGGRPADPAAYAFQYPGDLD